jgi:hypothetical protein
MMGRVENLLILLFALNVVAVSAVVMHLAARTDKVWPAAPQTPEGFPDAGIEAGLPGGRSVEEYVHAGLVDLRIMLVQAARRRTD